MFERFEKRLLDLNTELDEEIASNVNENSTRNEIEDSYNHLTDMSTRINTLYNEIDAVHNDLNTDDYTTFRGAWETVYEKCRVALVRAQQLLNQKTEDENELSYEENERQLSEENERIEAFTRKQEEIYYNNVRINEINKLIETNNSLLLERNERITRIEARLRFMDTVRHIEFSDAERELLTNELVFLRGQIEDLELANSENMNRMTELTRQNEEIYRSFTEWELNYQAELTKNKADKFEEQERQAELDRKQRDEERKRLTRSIAAKKAAETRRKNAEAKKLAEEEAKKAEEKEKIVEEEKKDEEALIEVPPREIIQENPNETNIDAMDEEMKEETDKVQEEEKKDEKALTVVPPRESIQENPNQTDIDAMDEEMGKGKDKDDEKKKKKGRIAGIVRNIKAPKNKLLLALGIAIGLAITFLAQLLSRLGNKNDKDLSKGIKEALDHAALEGLINDTVNETTDTRTEEEKEQVEQGKTSETQQVIGPQEKPEEKPSEPEKQDDIILGPLDVAAEEQETGRVSINAEGETYLDGEKLGEQELGKDKDGNSVVSEDNFDTSKFTTVDSKDGSKGTANEENHEVPDAVFDQTVTEEQKQINQEQAEKDKNIDEALINVTDINDLINMYKGR